MEKNIFRNRFFLILPILSAFLLIIAYPPAMARWSIFFALLPLFIFLSHADKKTAFWGSLFTGFLFIGWSIHWFFAVLPLDWAGITQKGAGIALAIFIWFLTTLTFSFFIGIFGYTWKLVPSRETRVLILASIWVILEYLRAWAFGIVWFGKESLLGPHWTFASLGYAATNFPLLLPAAKFIGLYGFSFLIIALNLVIYELVSTKKITKTHIGIAVVVLLLLFSNYQTPISGAAPSKKFALIQTNFPPQLSRSTAEFLKFITREIALLEEAKKQDPDVIVLPEGSNLSLQFGDETAAFFAGFLGAERSRTIIDSARLNESTKTPQRIFFYDTARGLTAIQDKTLLIPGGEYLPYLIEYPARLLGLKDWVIMFKEYRGLARGSDASENTRSAGRPVGEPRVQAGHPEGVLLCSSILSPSLWRDLTNNSARVLINAASQAILRGNPQFFDQAEAMIRFFAAENDRWLVQAANGGFSYIIDNQGNIRHRTYRRGNTLLIGEVQYRATKPLAVRFGNWPIAAAFGLLFFIHLRNCLRSPFRRETA